MTSQAVDKRFFPPSMTSDVVATNVRMHLAQDGTSLAAFAARLGVTALWAQRRFGAARSIAITVDDLTVVAQALGVDPDALLTRNLLS